MVNLPRIPMNIFETLTQHYCLLIAILIICGIPELITFAVYLYAKTLIEKDLQQEEQQKENNVRL
jgi:hypothetical protein